MTKLEKQLATVCDELAALKADETLDLDTAAQRVVTLEAKRGLLETKVAAERARLAAAENEAKRKARHTLLGSIAKRTEAAVANHQSLTDRAAALIDELVGVLAEREKAFSREAVGLTDAVRGVLTPSEVSELLAALDFMHVPDALPTQFGGSWRDAVARVVGNDGTPPARALHGRLAGLAPRSERLRGSGLVGVQPDLASKARHMSEVQS